MEVFVRGSRSSSRDWSAAQGVPLSELPPLDEQQKAEAVRGHVTEEAYARSMYAANLTGQKTLRRLAQFGRWLSTKIEERNAASQIKSLDLDTLAGKLEVRALAGGEEIDFEIDEDLVDRLLTAGSEEAEKSICRLLDVYFPQKQIARAS